jgi:hypothetical protein
MPCVWSNLRLSTWSKADKIDFILEHTGKVPLDVEIDTGADRLETADGNEVRYAGIERAVSVANPWRSLTIISFPTKTDIDVHLTHKEPAFIFDGLVDALEGFRIKNLCEDSIVFEQLLDIVGDISHGKLTEMELSSPNAIHHFA